jgi:hypothetical protein
MEIAMPSRRRSVLYYVLGPAAVTGGLLAFNLGARSATAQLVGIDADHSRLAWQGGAS